MCGTHCLKTWSKTQALVAKSSGEAELYAVVRGATEALGMMTLAKDLGRRVGVQLHIDALAAKGIIERKGLSKVRHLNVNVLWFQEQCARQILPIKKVPGEDNVADLMTKHLGAAKISKLTSSMAMEFSKGRAAKAAQLHLVQTTPEGGGSNFTLNEDIGAEEIWQSMSDQFADRRGGDRWRERGEGGVWRRVHVKPRRALFTPYKVAKGPKSDVKLGEFRFTKGVTESGIKFEFHDRWTDPETAHRLLDEKWIGHTTFVTADRSNLYAVQKSESAGTKPMMSQRLNLRWSELLFE